MKKNIRIKHGYRWADEESQTGFGTQEVYGFSVDHLDTKSISDATNLYEKVFILTRLALESNSTFCLDNDAERLQCCQDIADLCRLYGVTSK